MDTTKSIENVMEQPTLCTVEMDGKKHSSDDFVAILSRENGDASFFFNTDALTLGMAVKMVTRAFVETASQLTEEERQEIIEVLGEAFVAEVEPEGAPTNE